MLLHPVHSIRPPPSNLLRKQPQLFLTFAKCGYSTRTQTSTRSKPGSSIHADTQAKGPSSPTTSFRTRLIRTQQTLEAQIASLQRTIDALSLKVKVLSLQRGKRRRRFILYIVLFVLAIAAYNFSDTRFLTLACTRGLNVAAAVGLNLVDYKYLFWRVERIKDKDTEKGRSERHELYSSTHRRAARRLREVLKMNGGIYIKLGQHMSAVHLVPVEWREEMRELQDQCFPTPLNEIDALFQTDVGAPLTSFFSHFDPTPLGVASLAQVHRAVERGTGREVAVKLMHPNLEEFAKVDMRTTTFMLKVVKTVFPEFEFTWLGEEMEQNLPLEMDFRHEAANATRCRADFAHFKKTSLVIPEVLWAKKRVMLMEFIDGARVDDLQYLKTHHIDPNEVAKELARIFNQMIYLNGFFHADPHGGNLLIRPAKRGSRSPHNFEIVLLDHGLYFDIPRDLRINYAHFWLSLVSPASKKVTEERKYYAKLVGNIGDDMYPVFESAITGRSFEATNGRNLMELGEMGEDEARRIRHAVIEGGIIGDVFKILRNVPRRLLMVLKVNDLTRHLDHSLQTTHATYRVFLIVAQYCSEAIYLDRREHLLDRYHTLGLSFGLAFSFLRAWWERERWWWSLSAVEWWTDRMGQLNKFRIWMKGSRTPNSIVDEGLQSFLL